MYVCAFLSNLRPALVPPPQLLSDSDVDYLNALSNSDDDDPESSYSEYLPMMHVLYKMMNS